MSVIRKEFYEDGALVNVDPVVLRDETGAYGICKADGTVVVAAGTAMNHPSTGAYEYDDLPSSETPQTYNVAIQYVWKTITRWLYFDVTVPSLVTTLHIAPLTVGAGWLKNFDALVSDAAKGLTAADVGAAETSADNRVILWFGKRYDVAATAFRAAPVIVEIALMLGSAELIGYEFARDGKADTQLAAVLEEKAERLWKASIRTGLRTAAGALIAPLSPACPRVSKRD